jgi:hypothetical protein
MTVSCSTPPRLAGATFVDVTKVEREDLGLGTIPAALTGPT